MANAGPSGVIDGATFERLRADFGAGPDLRELVETYLSESAALVASLRTAAAAKDAKAMEQAAHSLKSSSALMGALAFSALCLRVETAGRAGSVVEAASLASQVVQDHPAVVAALKALQPHP